MAALGTTDEGTVALLRAHTLNCAGDSLVKEDAGASPMGMSPTWAAGSRVAGQGVGTGGPRRGHWESRGLVARHTLALEMSPGCTSAFFLRRERPFQSPGLRDSQEVGVTAFSE